ncbi:MAG TPA: hypothetical protein VH277_15690 [Gemmatimonadaceae bacterium]|nr:hypothetical protein [Gemmatimonadaceae bacterium]
MMHRPTLLAAMFAAASCAAIARPALAQTVERPIPFDSAQRVVVVTPPLAARLHLASPAWPVQGDFSEARLYAVQPAGGYVLIVQRAGGVVERFPLTDAERSTLASAIEAGIRASGRPSAEGLGGSGADFVSEPAGNAFARRQTILAALLYAPLAASLVDDASAAGAIYLLVTGGTFFATYGGAQSSGITRAQNELGGELGVMGGGAAWLAAYAVDGNPDRGTRAVALGGVIAGTIAGISLGRTMTDAEAHSASAGIRATGLTTWAATKGLDADPRAQAGAVAASALIGYPLGLAYARTAAYKVTAGDVEATGTAGLVGALYGGLVASAPSNPSDQQYAIGLGAGYVAGLITGDRLISRKYDLSQSQSSVAALGAVAGALMGLAIPVLAQSDNAPLIFGTTAVGATAGMAAVIRASNPRPEGRLGARSMRRPGGRLALQLDPSGAIAMLRGVPGGHSLVRLQF